MSSGSESDNDYVPEENPAKLSEDDSTDDEKRNSRNHENLRKRKAISKARKDWPAPTPQKLKRCYVEKLELENVDRELELQLSEQYSKTVEQKQTDDDLWASFLDGTDTKPKPKKTSKEVPKPGATEKVEVKVAKKDDTSDKDKKIFEFAGETIVVEDNVIKERIKTAEVPSTAAKSNDRRGASTSGISGLLGQINKKNKLTTLEKSKLDWMTFKKEEGIEEEITSHNKGKLGFLDRRDFLERTDHRQYEIERKLRMGRSE